MDQSIRATTKKRGRPKTTGKGAPIQVRLQPDLLAALDAFLAERPDIKSRPEAVRLLLSDALIGLRLLPLDSSAR